MNALRKEYFPTKSNKVDAHIYLFHGLPGSHLDRIKEDSQTLTSQQQPFKIVADRVFRLSKGVAISAVVPGAGRIYSELRPKWLRLLSRQDMRFKPHYIIQDFVAKDRSVSTVAELKGRLAKLDAREGLVEGLELWRYDKASWRDRIVYKFEGESGDAQEKGE